MGEHIVTVSISKSPLEELCPTEARMDACFYGGSILLDGMHVPSFSVCLLPPIMVAFVNCLQVRR